MVKKRIVLWGIALLTLGVVLTGTLAAAEPVTIRWFMRWDNARVENVAKPVIADFEKSHPNIKIAFENVSSGQEYTTRLLTLAAGGAMPDVLYPSTKDMQVMAAKGALYDLKSLMKFVDQRAYDRRILDLYKYKTGVYGLPIDRAALVLFYNKDQFDEAKVSYPDPKTPMTWEQFVELAKKVTKDKDGDGRIDQWGVHLDTDVYWQVFLYHMTGKNMFDDYYQPTKFLCKDPKAVAAIQFWGDMMNKHRIAPRPSERSGITDLFVGGGSAMNIIGHWRVPQYMANAKFKWDIVPLPHGPYKANRADGSCFAIGKNTKHPKEAWEFVKYLAGNDSPGVRKLLELQQMVPALTAYQKSDLFLKMPAGTPQINKQAFLAYSEKLVCCYQPMNTDFSEIDTIIRTELNKVWEGQQTAAQAMKNAAPKVESVLLQSSL